MTTEISKEAAEALKKKIDELRGKFPSDSVLEALGQVVVIRRPSRPAYSRYREYQIDDRKRSQANEALLADCIVFPPPGPEREIIFDNYPGLIDVFGNEAVRLAGGGAEAKKF